MNTYHCAQRGCTFDAESDAVPDNCPVCGNPLLRPAAVPPEEPEGDDES